MRREPVAEAPPAPAPVIHAAVTREHAARKLVVASERRAAPAPLEPRRASAAQPAMISAPRGPAAAAPAPATATAAPAVAAPASPAPSPVAVAAQRDDGIGNFGETYPASVEPSARSTLLGGVAGVVVRVTVDENGRAISVDFVREPADPAQRDELRARLLAAHFIPAACNGLRCTGTVTLRS